MSFFMNACCTGVCRRVTGIGMTGSLQLGKAFTPSPAVLAGEEDDEEEGDYAVDTAKEEVYVVRKTKSGRRAPLERAQFNFASDYIRHPQGSRPSPSRKKQKRAQHKPAAKGQKRYAESSSSEEEEESSESEDEVVDGYHPRPSKSRSGSQSPAKAPARPAKGANRTTGRKGAKAAKSAAKPAHGAAAKRKSKEVISESEIEEEENRDTYTPRPTKSGRRASGSTPVKATPSKRGRPSSMKKLAAHDDDEEEDFYEVEEEDPSPAKKKRSSESKGKGKKAATPKSETVEASPGRTPRTASEAARQLMKHVDDSGDESDEQYKARPSSTRSKK
jgi:hypothetical protein